MIKFFKLFLPREAKPRKRIEKLSTEGSVYNLQSIFDELNAQYFPDRLNVKITWGRQSGEARYRRRLGSYDRRNQVIRIHPILDQAHFPPYFISFIVYHEMLHHAFPPYRGKRGRWEIHHSLFKAKEKLFEDYAAARKWEKENFKLFFKGTYGRS